METENKPLISVLLPVYNTQEDYLREAIESILSQTYVSFEFIIINDGSTNNVEEVILSYKDDRIKYLKQENKGISATLNYGLSLAKGKYIARMDSDDISLPHRFAKQVYFLENNPSISLVGSWYEVFPKLRLVKYPKSPKILDFAFKGCLVGHPTVMFRKNDFDKYNLKYDTKSTAEDFELWMRALKYLNFENIEEVLLRYREHSDALTQKNKKALIDSAFKIQADCIASLSHNEGLLEDVLSKLAMSKFSIWQKIFSITNLRNYKMLVLLGFKFVYKRV